jgi:hypothetical protein
MYTYYLSPVMYIPFALSGLMLFLQKLFVKKWYLLQPLLFS